MKANNTLLFSQYVYMSFRNECRLFLLGRLRNLLLCIRFTFGELTVLTPDRLRRDSSKGISSEEWTDYFKIIY